MGAWAPLLQARGGSPLLGSSPTTIITASRGATSSLSTRRTVVACSGVGGGGAAGATPPVRRTRPSGSSSPSINGETQSWQEKKKRKKTASATTTATQKQQSPSVLEIQRAIGVASDVDDGGHARGDGGSRRASVLDFFASTPIGQAESPAERKLREAGEWLVERTESRGLFAQRILMVVCLNILPVWVFLLLVASGAVKLPFGLPFMDNLLS